MYKRLSVLASLPRVSLSPPANAPMRLRTPTTPEGMATSEAIARALELLGDADAAAALDRIFALMVQRLSRSGHR
jgi:DTW domain-containing protein YfiP